MTTMKIMEEMIKKLNDATAAYEEGHPIMSNYDWDKIFFELRALELKTCIILPDSPTQKIIYPIKVDKLNKIKHNHPMLSLDKTKDIEKVKDFIGKREWIAMAKMDGLTCSLTYENGKLISAETRGNGIVGEDILHNALVINSIPKRVKYEGTLIIDGEIICTYKNFENFNSEYKNPRNFASGSIRLLDSVECAKRKLDFIAWDCIEGLGKTTLLSDKLDMLQSEFGFNIVPYVYGNKEEFKLEDISYIKRSAKVHSYPIDGVVFKFDNCEYYESLGRTDHHYKGGLAYKFYDEEYETELLDIEWGMGRTGVLTPVARFKPIEIDGSIVERASLHNISIMEELLGTPYVGQKVWVIKSNQIIPQIIKAEKLP